MAPESLLGEQWLLAYEGRLKKWVPPIGSKEYVKTAPGFGALANAAVSFYDPTAALTYRPQSMQLLRMRLKLIAQAADDYPRLNKLRPFAAFCAVFVQMRSVPARVPYSDPMSVARRDHLNSVWNNPGPAFPCS